jgi:methionine synthase II (cobalamin-independent)
MRTRLLEGRHHNAAAMSRMPTHHPPFRADHIGSLLRPAGLRQAFRAFHAGELDGDRFAAARDAAIGDAIKLQEEVGLLVVTDGELRRGSYWSGFVEGVEGLEVAEARFKFHDEHGHELSFTAPHVTGKPVRRRPIALDEFTFLRDHATVLPKVTLPAPSTMLQECRARKA